MPRVFGAPFESDPIEFSSKSIGVTDLQPLSYYAALTAFKRFDLIPACDGQTDRQTAGQTHDIDSAKKILAWDRTSLLAVSNISPTTRPCATGQAMRNERVG